MESWKAPEAGVWSAEFSKSRQSKTGAKVSGVVGGGWDSRPHKSLSGTW